MSKKQKQPVLVKFRKLYFHASPAFRKRFIGILACLVFLNGSVWLYTLLSIHHYPMLLGLVTLAYTLGLRHAVDADHIAAIDNTT